MQPILIYLHGFMSSPSSVKAQATIQYVKKHHPELEMEVPTIPNYPDQAVALLESIVTNYQDRRLKFIGSSMGGFLATYLVEKFGGRAVLINPAVKPFELLSGYLGNHVNPYTGATFFLEQKHIIQLREFDTPQLKRPSDYWALLQTNDETLDYRQAKHKYAASKLLIEQGGDHSFQNYDRHLADIFDFLMAD